MKTMNMNQGKKENHTAESDYRTQKNGPDEKDELRDMRSYWDACARDNAMRHIAVNDWETEEIFHKCGERDLERLLSNINREYLKSGNYNVLEIGCGIGRIIRPLAVRYPNLNIYGVDVSEEMIRKGKQRLNEFKNIKLFANNGKDLNIFEDKYFHLVYSYIVFQHIPRKFVLKYFEEISRKLIESGVLIFQMSIKPDDIELKDPPDTDFRTLRHYSIKKIDMLCNSNGLSIVKEVFIGRDGKYSASVWFTAMKIKQ